MILKSFAQKLISWYHKNARDLPWRRTRDPYKIWLSEVMLQQTTVNTVIPYYERWVKEFPTVAHVTRASIQKILKRWQGLGYYQRAKNFHKAAEFICRHYDGQLPNDPEQLCTLPGFGPYTVGAVSSIAFDCRMPIVDANVRRVMMRILAIKGQAVASQDKKILSHLEQWLPKRDAGTFNQALMELGALVCRSKEPLCMVCPLRNNCRAYEKGLQEIIPTPQKRIIQDVEVAVALIQKGNKYFIQKRPATGLFADLWEFPGGKIEKGETPQKALYREVKEELDINVASAQHLFNVRQFYTQFRANLHIFRCECEGYPATNHSQRWVSLKEIHRYPMPSGSAKIVDKLKVSD